MVPVPCDVSVWSVEAFSVIALPVPSSESAVLPTMMVLFPPVFVIASVPPLPAAIVRPLPTPVPVADRVRLLKVKLPPVFVPLIASRVLLKPLLFDVRLR